MACNTLNKLRKEILRVSYESGACHIGSALSCLEIIYNLYFKTMRKDEEFFNQLKQELKKYPSLEKHKGKYGICQGKILVRIIFNSYKEAMNWGKWNYKGRMDNWKIVKF